MEGPCEYILAHAIGNALGYSLDAHGISVVDFQNRGTVWSFAILARALGIPWIALFDGDAEPNAWMQKLKGAGFSDAELATRVLRHPERNLEHAQAATNETLFRRAAALSGIANADTLPVADLLVKAGNRKTEIAVKTAELLRETPALIAQMPPQFVAVIQRLPGLAP